MKTEHWGNVSDDAAEIQTRLSDTDLDEITTEPIIFPEFPAVSCNVNVAVRLVTDAAAKVCFESSSIISCLRYQAELSGKVSKNEMHRLLVN